jgi:hypothetical protein
MVAVSLATSESAAPAFAAIAESLPRVSALTSRSERRESRCGTRVFATLSIRRRKRKDAIFQDSVLTRSGGPTLRGGKR